MTDIVLLPQVLRPSSSEICMSLQTPAVDGNGLNAQFDFLVHCLSAEARETILRLVVLDGDTEVAYETAVLGALRPGYRCFHLRQMTTGTRIELCSLLVHLEFGEAPHMWHEAEVLQEHLLQRDEEIGKLQEEMSELQSVIGEQNGVIGEQRRKLNQLQVEKGRFRITRWERPPPAPHSSSGASTRWGVGCSSFSRPEDGDVDTRPLVEGIRSNTSCGMGGGNGSAMIPVSSGPRGELPPSMPLEEEGSPLAAAQGFSMTHTSTRSPIVWVV